MSTRGSRFKQQDGIFGRVIDGAIEEGSTLLNAIDFIDSPQGFNFKLFPLQRLIVKCIFAVPIDYKPVMIDMWDIFREKITRTVTEEECLHILYEEGRCNIKDWRDIPKRGFNEATIFAGRRGGKMLHVDTPIPTPYGFVRNGDLKDGDEVFGENGEVYKVKYAHPIETLEAYKVSFDDGTFVYTHAGHKWHTFTKKERKNLACRKTPQPLPEVEEGLCKCGCGLVAPVSRREKTFKGFIRGHHLRRPRFSQDITGGVRTTQEILESLLVISNKSKPPQLNHSVRLTQPLELPDTPLILDPYCLGVWLGDGSSAHGHITASLEDGVEIMRQFDAAGYTWRHNDAQPVVWKVYGLPLDKLGVLRNKHIPHEYLWASKAQRLALLQGLMDSDGSCLLDGQCEFSNTNRGLSEGVYHLAASLGLKPYWREKTPVCTNSPEGRKACKTAYLVQWTGDLPVFRLSRKLSRIPKKLKSTQKWRYISNVERVGVMDMRCITTSNPSHLYLFGANFNVTHNSEVVAAIGGYKLYQLLNVRSPQSYFGIKPNSPIDFTFMAQDEEGSGRLFNKLREGINTAPFFNPYLKTSSASSLGFVSEADRHKRDVTPTINVASFACTTNASRGPSNIFLALDEFAFFRGSKGSSSEEVYSSATPSTVNFKHAETLEGEWINQDLAEKTMDRDTFKLYRDSLILSISSPWVKVGKMYDLHKLALEKGCESGIFTMRLSTAEMNPTILPETLHSEYQKNPLTFKAEYGGQFLESSESYLTEAQIRTCTDVTYVKSQGGFEEPDDTTARFNLSRFHPSAIGRQYFWAIDLGMTHDATAVAIGHLEYRGGAQPIHLVYDYIDRMMVGEKFDGVGLNPLSGVDKYVNYKALPLEDILAWFKALNELMPCYRGATDQHGGQQLVQLLDLNKIHNIELVNLTSTLNSQMAYVLQGYVRDQRCHFPFVPKFLKELRLVEAEYVNKYQIRVAAPLEKGSHDDMVDAAQICAYKAQKWLMEEGGLKFDPTGQSILMSQQMSQPSQVIGNLDGVMLRDLQIMERMKKIQSNMDSFSGAVVRSPFHKRGR
jgi:hypothetical protein